MKKIIAMLLCVAMIAAMGVSAFAANESLTAPHSYEYYWNKKVDGKYAYTGIVRDYAAGLAAAKSAYNDAKDAFSKVVKALPDAQARLIYTALGEYYTAAAQVLNIQFGNALNQALAEFEFELYSSIQRDDFAPGWFGETAPVSGITVNGVAPSSVWNATPYEEGKGVWTDKGWPDEGVTNDFVWDANNVSAFSPYGDWIK